MSDLGALATTFLAGRCIGSTMDSLGVALTREILDEVEFIVGTHDIFVLGL
jgi:hypothetical protein